MGSEMCIRDRLLLQKKGNYKDRFVIKTTSGIYLLDALDISLVQASGTFCKLIDYKGKIHILSQSIGSLVEVLNPKVFFRVNRSQIIHIKYIGSMETYFKNRLLLHMKGTKEKVLTSSSVTADFRSWLDQT